MSVESLLQQLTLDEKLSLCAGAGSSATVAIPRLGIHAIRMADGPQGIRAPRQPGGFQCVALPCGIALSAAFDPLLAEKYGRAIALDAKALGISVSLGPGLNLMRTPLCGRNFEYYGEDPVLAGKTAAGYVRGCQAENVAATPKHLALNNQEICRTFNSSDIDERSLRELYLTGFEIVTRESSPWLIMSSYNRINGTYASECGLVQELIVKREWGFDGVMVSDWGGAHDTAGCMLGGLDLDMPGGGVAFVPEKMRHLILSGAIPESVLDDKVRRILKLLYRTGAVGTPITASGKPGDAEQRQIAAEIAAESIVLLKNENSFLPFDRKKIRRILLTGPNADFRNHRGSMYMLGGSGAVFSDREVTIREGLQDYADRHGIELEYLPFLKFDHDIGCPRGFFGENGIECTYFNSREDMDADRNALFSVPNFDGIWDFAGVGSQAADTGIPGLPRRFAVRMKSRLTPDSPAPARMSLTVSNGQVKIRLNGKEIFAREGGNLLCQYEFKENEAVNAMLEIDYYPHSTAHAGMRIAWSSLNDAAEAEIALFEAAKRADAVIFAGGSHHLYDREGLGRAYDPSMDIPDLELPAGQSPLISRLAAANPNIAVLLVGGSVLNVEPWLGQVRALLDLWYPGEAGGSVAAELLFGERNPAGHLPFTWGKQLNDYACHADGNYPGTVSGDARVCYAEGIFIGYRHFDRSGIEPRFPFGYGLSYSQFDCSVSGFEIISDSNISAEVKVSLSAKNLSAIPGSELLQLYVGAVDPEFPRPVKELKSFAKLHLAPGESRTVEMTLKWRDFACWHPEKHHWCLPGGRYKIFAGRNAADIFWEKEFVINEMPL